MMEAGEALLYVLSSNGALPWQRLKEVVEELRQGGVASESAQDTEVESGIRNRLIGTWRVFGPRRRINTIGLPSNTRSFTHKADQHGSSWREEPKIIGALV